MLSFGKIYELIERYLKQTFYFIAGLSILPIIMLIGILVLVSGSFSQAVKDGNEWSNIVSQTIDMRRLSENFLNASRENKIKSEDKSLHRTLFMSMYEELSSLQKVNENTDFRRKLDEINIANELMLKDGDYAGVSYGIIESLESFQDQALSQLKMSIMKEQEYSEQLKNLVVIGAVLFLFLILIVSVLSKGVLSSMFSQQKMIAEQQVRLVSQSNLASLGKMAGGLAHEINNPLGAITMSAGQIQNLQQRKKLDQENLGRFLDYIFKSSDRIAKIVDGLMKFSSKDAEQNAFVRVRVTDILDRVIDFSRAKPNAERVDFQVQISDKAIFIDCEEIKMTQVLNNLIDNALYAVQGVSSPRIKIEVHKSSEYVEIAVVDNGVGIKEEDQDKVLEPFFTNKPIGTGTGLGLSIAAGICKSHKGDLYLDKSSKYTRFVLKLPFVQEHGKKLKIVA